MRCDSSNTAVRRDCRIWRPHEPIYPLTSPAVGHWGTCPPLNFHQLIFGTLLWSYVKYRFNFWWSNIFRILRTTVIKIMLIIFFILLKNMKMVSVS